MMIRMANGLVMMARSRGRLSRYNDRGSGKNSCEGEFMHFVAPKILNATNGYANND